MKILIDNGHGCNTAGKKSPYSLNRVCPALAFEEWAFNREIARRLTLKLRAAGYDAQQLVVEKTDVSLQERCRRANAFCNQLGAGNVIFISIHANAFGMGDKWNDSHGWAAYTSKGNTKADVLCEEIYKAAEKSFAGRKIRRDCADGDSDYEENFYVLAHTACPAVLTENFFYTNVDDTQFLLSETGKAKIVEAHYNGIVNYIKNL